ncbi:Imm50 family immunity protein [Halobacillus sp. MO56]
MWHEHLTDNKFISMIYTSVPPLNDIRIERIAISHEGDQVQIGFDMPFYADKPPMKWVERGYTTTFIEIDFSDVKEVGLKSNNNTYRGNIDIKTDSKGDFIVNITGEVEAQIKAGAGLIQTVSGY